MIVNRSSAPDRQIIPIKVVACLGTCFTGKVTKIIKMIASVASPWCAQAIPTFLPQAISFAFTG